MFSFIKRTFLSRNRIFIVVLASAGLFFKVLPVSAQVSLAPLNPDFVEYFQKPQISGVQAMTVEGYPLGLIPPPLDLSHLTGLPIVQANEFAAAPSSYDLRVLGKVTPVRDQGACGSCWTFATYGSLESKLLPSEAWDFSENNLKDTHGFDPGPCVAGNGLMSTAYLGRWSGPISEGDDPYSPSSDISPSGLVVRKHLEEVLFIPGRASALDNDNIKQAIMIYGALMTSMYFDPACPSCSSFNSTHHTYYYDGTMSTNHGVTIVGWDDNFDKNKFSIVPPGDGAFIIKNSWGTDWGENGYFYISYYDTQTAGKLNFMFNGAEPTTDYSRIYQYDPLGLVNGMGYRSNTAWFANIFTASAREALSAVSFYTGSPNSSFEVSVYKNVSSGPTSGTLSSSRTGTIAIPGFHTIPLIAPVSLASGQNFSVVVKLTTPGYNYPISVEMPISGYSSKATAQAGESYVSSDGTNWDDLTDLFPNANVCLKALSNDQGANLTPYQPPGWSDKIVVTNKTGCTSMACTDSGPLNTTDTLYVDWAVVNNGSAATSFTFYTQLYVDGVAKSSSDTNPPLNSSDWVFVPDYSIGSLGAGTHTIKIVADSTGVIEESDESDNEYTKTITVLSSSETVSAPSTPLGSTSGNTGVTYAYSTGGATSNFDHPIQYRFDWGDGTYSEWSSLTTASKSWETPNAYSIKAQARCANDPLVVSGWSSGLTVNVTEPILLQSPSNNEHFSGCSLYALPTFSWTVSETFRGYQIQFSLDTIFGSGITVKTSGTQITMTSANWKKVSQMSGVDGGTVYWRVVGTRANKTTFMSRPFPIVVDPPQPVGNAALSTTSKSPSPGLSWLNHCNIKFKAWFGSDAGLSQKTGYSFSTRNPVGGDFSKALTSGQWKAIRKLAGDATGSTIYWYVESWDGLNRYTKTDTMSFVLTD